MFNFNTMEHFFIAFEGPEGSGKGTQIELLKKDFNAMGIEIHTTCEPTNGPIGKLIRQVLGGNVILTTEALQTLFTADRIEHQKEIIENLKNSHVISDRYFGSTISYIQTIKISKELLEAITKLNTIQRAPDIWIYLRCSVDESIASIAKRNGTPEIYDKREKLEQILFAYDNFFESRDNVIISMRNGKDVNEVHEEIMLKLRKIMKI